MIVPAEIQQKAREAGVRDTQMEKDYVLSWILQGVAHHEQLRTVLVFKGGTVLKKFYFEDYRFSEDLEFLLPEFSQKCKHKGLQSADFEDALQKRLPLYQARWTGSISDQIQELPEFEQVEREVQRHFRSIEF